MPPRNGEQQPPTFWPSLLWHGRPSQLLLSTCFLRNEVCRHCADPRVGADPSPRVVRPWTAPVCCQYQAVPSRALRHLRWSPWCVWSRLLFVDCLRQTGAIYRCRIISRKSIIFRVFEVCRVLCGADREERLSGFVVLFGQ